MITVSINQLTVQLTIVQRNVNYQTMILQVSYKSSSIICTANDTISSAFPTKQHANPLTIYLRMNALSINQHKVQLTIVQTDINYQTMILLVHYMSSRIMSNANTQLVQHFHSNSMQILIQYISAHDCAFNASTNNSTNNCSKKYQLPNHDLASPLHVKQNYI